MLTGTLVFAAGAFADAGNPIIGTIKASATQGVGPGGRPTVTIYVRGQWNWLSHGSDCNTDRAATGAGIIWNDVNGGGASAGNNEKQRVALSGTVAGATFKLTFKNPAGTQSTSALINSADTATILDGKLEAMPSIGAGNVVVTGGPGTTTPWDIEFTGSLAKTNVNALTAGNKSGGLTVTITTPTPGTAPVTNGYLVSNGGISAYVGSQGNDLNPADRMVHPVDRGNQVEGYMTAGTDYAATQQFADPAPTAAPGAAQVAAWKGGCGRIPISATASKNAPGGGPNGEAKGRPCAGAAPSGNTLCAGQPWGSWGYEKGTAPNLGYSHTYYADQLPDRVCVNFYDVHGGGAVGTTSFQLVKSASEITVDGNGDNSIDTNAFNVFDTGGQGGNCITFLNPAITTTATSAVVGEKIHDTAHLTGVAAGAGGTITFKAYKRAGSTAACAAGTLAFTSNAIPVNGVGDYDSNDFTTAAAGTYDWIAEYTGDPASLTLATSTTCGDAGETSTVTKKSPGLTTDAGGPYTIGVNGTVGLTDTGTLSGSFPGLTATITYKLYSDSLCATQVGTDKVTNISADGSTTSSPAISVSAAGTYHWRAFYSGNDDNNATSTPCGDTGENPVVNPRDTSITTDAGGPYTFNAGTGNDIADQATISGGTSNAGGSLTFKLYSDANCATQVGSTVTPTSGNPINGANGITYTSNTVHVSSAGTYHWRAFYTGDTNNNGFNTTCGDTGENPQVLNPSIDIQKTPDTQTVEGTSQANPNGTSATFHITVSNNGAVALSDVKVTDANSPDCDRSIAQIQALLVAKYGAGHTSMGVGESVTYDCTSPLLTTGLTFHNVANTEGFSQGVKVTDSDDADVTIIHPQIDVEKNPKSQSIPSGGTANFTIKVTNTGDTALDGIVITDPNATDCNRTAAQTEALIVAKYGAGHTALAPGEFFSYACAKTNVTQNFLNVVEACGDDVLNTNVCDTDTDNGGPPTCPEAARCGSVTVSSLNTKQDFKPTDTATINGLTGTIGGSVTWELYKDGAGQTTCDAAHLIYSDTQSVTANGMKTTNSALFLSALNDAAGFGTGTAGNYNWKVSYSGDANGNAAIPGACGDENFQIDNG